MKLRQDTLQRGQLCKRNRLLQPADGVNFIVFGVGGGQAAENYDQLFTAGEDLDVYFCEADWALKYINDDTKTLDLAKLGLSDSDFPNIYEYTDAIGIHYRNHQSGERCPEPKELNVRKHKPATYHRVSQQEQQNRLTCH